MPNYLVVMGGPIANHPNDPRPFVYIWLAPLASDGTVTRSIRCYAAVDARNEMLAVALAAMSRRAPVSASVASDVTLNLPEEAAGAYQIFSLYLIAPDGEWDPTATLNR